MKYLLNYRERPSGSVEACEATQERALGLFQTWEMPATLKIHQFLSRLGEFGGYIIVETEQPADLHFLTTVFAVFECRVEPVLDVVEALPAELRAIAYRKSRDAGLQV